MITAKKLRELLHYDPATGVFRCKIARKRLPIGATPGGKGTNGYWRIKLCGVEYLAHRLAWLYVTGDWPDELDHVNLVRDDNRFENLRVASASENNANRPRPKHNTTGLKGAHKHSGRWGKWSGLFKSSIAVNGENVFLGYFDTKEAAHSAYCAASKKLHGEFARAA